MKHPISSKIDTETLKKDDDGFLIFERVVSTLKILTDPATGKEVGGEFVKSEITFLGSNQ